MLAGIVLCLGMISPAVASQPRLVTVGGAVTETVFALGAGEQVVAVDTSSTYPAIAASRPKVGYARTLAAEGILAMRPDHVLASEHAGPDTVFAQLRAAGVQVTRVPDSRSVDDTVAMIQTLSGLLQQPERGQQLLAGLSQAVERLPAEAPAARDAIVVIGGQGGQLMVAGRGTAADAMLALVGVRNKAAEFGGYRPVGDEALLQMRPSAIVVPDHALRAFGGVDGLRKRPGLAGYSERQIIVMDSLLLLGMGPRLGEAANQLSQSLDRVAR